jgi:RND superfamily putative drug exporter
MQDSCFFRLGEQLHRFRWLVIVSTIVALLMCLPFLSQIMTPFQSTGFIDDSSESARAERYLDQQFKIDHNNQFIILYHSSRLLATSDVFQRELKKSLSGLKHFEFDYDVVFPDTNPQQISKDKHTAYVVLRFHHHKPLDHEQLITFQKLIKKPKHMSMHLGGEAIFTEGVNQQTQTDLYKADMIAAPVSIIVLLLVFGSFAAALVPMCLGGVCALMILTLLYGLGHVFTLSIFTLNIALLLGLCLNLDYSLFIISRFRNELRQNGGQSKQALAMTLKTAGRAVFFSGLAVFASLSALLLFPINILFSIGVGGLIATFIAVCMATLVLPAILAVLNHGIDTWPIKLMSEPEHGVFAKLHRMSDRVARWPILYFIVSVGGAFLLLLPACWLLCSNIVRWTWIRCSRDKCMPTWHVWRSIAQRVVSWPVLFFVSSLSILLLLGYPFLNAHFGVSDYHILPEHSKSRTFFDTYRETFNENELTPIVMIVSNKRSSILSPRTISKLYDFTTKLGDNPAVIRVDSIVTTIPRLSKAQYRALYHHPNRANPALKELLESTTRKHFTVIRIVCKYDANSPKTAALIHSLREMNPGKGLTLQLTGSPVINADVHHAITRIFPYAIAWIAVLTYLILLLVLRSLFLPLKAIFMNILSLSASYGVLVYVFQEGHFSHWLHFDPQGILDISLIIIVFCAIFGFSMDYEVFLLTRIQESYRETKDNKQSIIFGIEQSSRIITSAALIVICICGSFMVADVLMVKEFGLGIAMAIFVDAFIIRSLLVPSTMVLLKSWNWYLPKWLDRLLP